LEKREGGSRMVPGHSNLAHALFNNLPRPLK